MRVSEIYLSVQGEGPRVGLPTVFIRFGGCNLRCPGWPCDTQHAIDPKYRSEWLVKESYQIFEETLLAAGHFEKFNVCFTGGEPFLQSSEQLHQLTEMFKECDQVDTIECFSNGTFIYPYWAIETISFIMDWKLPGSGEDMMNANRIANIRKLKPKDAIKFVIKDRDDYEAAKTLFEDSLWRFDVQVFYGAVWGEITNAELAGWVMDDGLPWRLNIQTHNLVWDRQKRGI